MVRMTTQKVIVHVAIFIVALLPLVTATEKHTKNITNESNDHKVLEVIHICISYSVSSYCSVI